MARLGKRERAAKAALIACNVSAPRPAKPLACGPMGFGGSTLDIAKLHGRTHHMGAYGANGGMGREAHGRTGGSTRFSGNTKTCDVQRTVMVAQQTDVGVIKVPVREAWTATKGWQRL